MWADVIVWLLFCGMVLRFNVGHASVQHRALSGGPGKFAYIVPTIALSSIKVLEKSIECQYFKSYSSHIT